MKLDALEYSEFVGQEQEWILENVDLNAVNLIVGKNSVGKSRLLNVAHGLAKMLRGNTPLFRTGNFKALLSDDKQHYLYRLELDENKVKSESLTRNDKLLISRNQNGQGFVWSEKLDQEIEIEIPANVLVASSRRDAVQHPYLDDLFKWGHSLRYFPFGSSLGRNRAVQVSGLDKVNESFDTEVLDAHQVTEIYLKGYAKYLDEYDKRIIADLNSLGYPVSDVRAVSSDNIPGIQGPPVVLLEVKEVELKGSTGQLQMSQGMFRALSLVIQLNFYIFEPESRTILIDDIGEGLDFARAQSFISLLIDRAKEHNLQLIMTTNDRFVMNGIPLEYWTVLKRSGNTIRVFNKRNSEKLFNDFEYLGLNNFDFFSSNFIEEGLGE